RGDCGIHARRRRLCPTRIQPVRVSRHPSSCLDGAQRTLRPWQREDERGPAAGSRADGERPTHSLRQLAGDVETEAGAARRAGQLRIAAIELLEDSLLLFARDSRARVAHGDLVGAVDRGDGDRDRWPPVLEGVVDEVDEDLLDPVAVAEHVWLAGSSHFDVWVARQLERPSHELRDVDLLLRDGHLTVVEPG